MTNSNLNVVDQLKAKIESAAKSRGLGVRFAQTNHGSFACTSRVYIFPADDEPMDVRGKSVIDSWSFDQPQTAGTTTRCKRYRVYSDVLAYIESL